MLYLLYERYLLLDLFYAFQDIKNLILWGPPFGLCPGM